MAAGLVVLVVAIGGSFATAQRLQREPAGGPGAPTLATGTFSDSGTLQQGESIEVPLGLADLEITWLIANLTWMDEADAARHTNQPDSFSIDLVAPDGETATDSGSNTRGAEGALSVARQVAEGGDPLMGDWTVTVTLTDAGDQTATFDLFGLRNQADDSNAWALEVSFEYRTAGAGPK